MSSTELNDIYTGAPFGWRGRKSSGAAFVEDQASVAGTGFEQLPQPNTPYQPGRWFKANCTAAGLVTVTAADGSSDQFMLTVGTNIIHVAVVSWSIPAQGGATATFSNIL